MSPVPGGMSTMRKSRLSQKTSLRNCSIGLVQHRAPARSQPCPRQRSSPSTSPSPRRRPVGTIDSPTITGGCRDSEHPGDREAPDVAVDDPDFAGRSGPGPRPGCSSPTTCRHRPCRRRPQPPSSRSPALPAGGPAFWRSSAIQAPAVSSSMNVDVGCRRCGHAARGRVSASGRGRRRPAASEAAGSTSILPGERAVDPLDRPELAQGPPDEHGGLDGRDRVKDLIVGGHGSPLRRQWIEGPQNYSFDPLVPKMDVTTLESRISDLTSALGDPTRRAIYIAARESPEPMTTSQVAELFGLHPNVARTSSRTASPRTGIWR